MADKQKSDVRGYQTYCVNFVGCPICYGCRNYVEGNSECEECAKDFKKNICNTKKHTSQILSKMFYRNKIKLNDHLTF